MDNRKIRVAITHGDTNGIGYELIFKTFAEQEMLELCTPVIYGSPKIATYHRKALNIDVNFHIINSIEEVRDGRVNLLSVFDNDVKVEFGTPTKESDDSAQKAVNRATEDVSNGLCDVLVAAPTNKDVQTTLTGESKALTILANKYLRVGFITNELPIKDIPQAISKDLIIQKAVDFINSLKRDFSLYNPRIAVLSLNPENGKEEQEIITPAIEELRNSDILAFGPFAADHVFSEEFYESFDGLLAMYHAQGFTPVIALAPNESVLLNAALPIVCTETCNDPEFDIAGKGIANESAFRSAVYLAIDVYRNRKIYDKPFSNPLKKLYRERHDENDKTRFSISKHHETNT